MKGQRAMSLVRHMLKFAAGIFLLGLSCSLGGATAPATALPSATFTEVADPTVTVTVSSTFTDVPGAGVGATAATGANGPVASPTLFSSGSSSSSGNIGSTGGAA